MFVALGFTHSFRTCKRTHGGMRRFPEFGVWILTPSLTICAASGKYINLWAVISCPVVLGYDQTTWMTVPLSLHLASPWPWMYHQGHKWWCWPGKTVSFIIGSNDFWFTVHGVIKETLVNYMYSCWIKVQLWCPSSQHLLL
jgi:hypothetical protein